MKIWLSLRGWWTPVFLAAALAGLAVPGITREDLSPAAAGHAMDGLFIRDLLAARPWNDFLEWTTEYLARFPAVGAGMFRPPAFAISEGLAFSIFGPQPWAGRLVVMLYAMGAVLILWRVGVRFYPMGAVAGIALLLTTPLAIDNTGEISLAWPTCFWMSLGVLALVRCRTVGTARWAVLLAAATVIGTLTHPLTLLVPAVWLTDQSRTCTKTFVVRASRLPMRITSECAAGISPAVDSRAPASARVPMIGSAILLGAYAVLFRRFLHLPFRLLVGTVPFRHLLNVDTYLYYPQAAVKQLGLPFLAALMVAAIIGLSGRGQPGRRIGLWASLLLLVIGTFAAAKATWLLIPMAAAPAMAAAETMIAAERATRRGGPRLFLAAIVFLQIVLGPLRETVSRPTFRPVVNWLAAQPDARVILYDGPRSEQFVFDVARHADAGRRVIPLTGESVLFSDPLTSRWTMDEPANTEERLLRRIHEYQIRWVVHEPRIEAAGPTRPAAECRQALEQTLSDPQHFKLEAELADWVPDKETPGMTVGVYRYLGAPLPPREMAILPLPVWGREVAVLLR